MENKKTQSFICPYCADVLLLIKENDFTICPDCGHTYEWEKDQGIKIAD